MPPAASPQSAGPRPSGQAAVPTVRGPVPLAELGRVFMHEHVFVLNEEIRQNYVAGWDEDQQVAGAAAKLTALAARGIATIADPTVIGLGRNIPRIQRIAEQTPVNIVVATGLYTYNDLPLYFRYRGADSGTGGLDPMTELFAADITEGIAGTGVKAAFLKCAIEDAGLTPGVERVLRAVARAHLLTGAPVMVHTHPASQSGLTALRVLTEEGADPSRVLMAHSGDSTDLNYLTMLADAGCLLGMDRSAWTSCSRSSSGWPLWRRWPAGATRAAWCCRTTRHATSTGSHPA